jgi:alpha-tubulin suppressor-like RCC1 family protein
VYCWGSTVDGQCGIDGGGTGNRSTTPNRVPAIDNSHALFLDRVRLIETVANHTCAVRTANPTLVCWGSNRYDMADSFPGPKPGEIIHKLGATTRPYSHIPMPIDLGMVLDIGMSFESTFAIAADGKTYAWGLNRQFQLGIDSGEVAVAKPTPVLVIRASANTPLANVAKVNRTYGAGNCARLHEPLEGSRYACWGTDNHGELGFGVLGGVARTAKSLVVLPPDAEPASLVQGEGHACATLSTSTGVEIWCYGDSRFTGTAGVYPRLSPAPLMWKPERFWEGIE